VTVKAKRSSGEDAGHVYTRYLVDHAAGFAKPGQVCDAPYALP
jgi:hypothetical protein